jgi:hypothetical protein
LGPPIAAPSFLRVGYAENQPRRAERDGTGKPETRPVMSRFGRAGRTAFLNLLSGLLLPDDDAHSAGSTAADEVIV